MSQIAMNQTERIAALRRFGYTQREAEFLCLAALHGGYFLRRQYGLFAGKASGGIVAALVEKLIQNGHAKVTALLHNTFLYHLGARPFYEAIGQEDNRNRRERQPQTIKQKLMSLDFVLAHLEYQFLATEQEKVDYFTRVRGIEAGQLPAKLYRGRGRSEAPTPTTVRYFVDKYPIFLRAGAQGLPSVVSFSFVDEGLTTPSHWETYLSQYGPLLLALGEFNLIYVAAGPSGSAAPRWAERTLERFLARTTGQTNGLGTGSDAAILDHFEARAAFESKNFSAFDRTKLVRYREDRERLSGPKIDALFELWKSGGEVAVAAALASETSGAKAGASPLRATFSTQILEHPYDLFGTLIGA